MNPEFTIALLGDGGVGKTCFVKKLLGQAFSGKYLPTLDCEESVLDFNGTKLTILDFGGQQKFGGSRQAVETADGAILMFDLQSKLCLKNLDYWFKGCAHVPKVVCATKCELNASDHQWERIAAFLQTHPVNFFLVSSRIEHNISEPVDKLIEMLV